MVFLSLNVITRIARPSSSGITPQNRKRLCSCGSTLSGRSITLMHHSFFRYGRFLRTSFSKYSVNLYPVVTMFTYYMLFWALIEYLLRVTAELRGAAALCRVPLERLVMWSFNLHPRFSCKPSQIRAGSPLFWFFQAQYST